MSSLSLQLVPIIEEIFLQEIGEGSSKPYQFKKQNEDKYTFMASIGTGSKVQVTVDFQNLENFPAKEKILTNIFKETNNQYNVAYKVEAEQYQYAKTEAKNLLRILSTIVLIIKDFINNKNPDLLYIEGPGKFEGGADNKKIQIYRAFLQKQIIGLEGYHSQDKFKGFVIFKSEIRN